MKTCVCGCGRRWRPLNKAAIKHPECNGRPVTPRTRKWPTKPTAAERRARKAAQQREAARIEAAIQAARAARQARRWA